MLARAAPAKTPAKITDRYFAVCFAICISGYATLHAPNLRKDLGRNEPQFRTARGLIRARFCVRKGEGQLEKQGKRRFAFFVEAALLAGEHITEQHVARAIETHQPHLFD